MAPLARRRTLLVWELYKVFGHLCHHELYRLAVLPVEIFVSLQYSFAILKTPFVGHWSLSFGMSSGLYHNGVSARGSCKRGRQSSTSPSGSSIRPLFTACGSSRLETGFFVLSFDSLHSPVGGDKSERHASFTGRSFKAL